MKKWNIDFILCSILVLILPYSIFDVWVRAIIKSELFQVDWIFVGACLFRLIILTLNRSLSFIITIRTTLRIYQPFLLVIIYTIFLTIVFIIDKEQFLGVNVSHNPLLFIFSRGVKYISYLFLSIYISIVVNDNIKISRIISYLAAGLCITEVLAVVQFLVFSILKFNIFPIIRTNMDGWIYYNTTVPFLGQNFLRLNSISHEPKGLAFLMSFLFIIKIYWRNINKQLLGSISEGYFNSYMQKTAWITLGIGVFTFSSSWITLFLFILLILFVLKRLGLNSSSYKSINFPILCLIIGFLLFFYDGNNIQNTISSFLDSSINRRLGSLNFSTETVNSLDPEDGAIFHIFNKFSLLSLIQGLGFGGFSNLSYDFMQDATENIRISPFSRNLFIELFFSSGIIGVLASFYFFKKNILKHIKKRSAIHCMLSITILMSFFVRSNEILFFICLGILVGSSSLEKHLSSVFD